MRKKEIQRRKRIRKKREEIDDRELFLSNTYQDSLRRFARALSKRQDLVLKTSRDETPQGRIACTDGNIIYLNLYNSISSRMKSREKKLSSHEGLIAHECGHIRYTDFAKKMRYLNGLMDGTFYPELPVVASEADKEAWDEWKGFLDKNDMPALLFIKKLAAHIRNMLEDVYIEACMCSEYPGSVRDAIQMNASVLISDIPTEKKRKAENSDELSIMLDMIFRYARAGRTKAESGYSKKYLLCLDSCRSIIDGCVLKADAESRLSATNRLILKLWRYVRKEISDLKAQMQTESGQDIQEIFNRLMEQKSKWCELSVDNGEMQENVNESPADPSHAVVSEDKKNGNDHDLEEQQKHEERKLEAFRGGIPQAEHPDGSSKADSKKTCETQNDEHGLEAKLSEILNEIASEQVNRMEEHELKQELQSALHKIEFDKIHKECQFKIHRSETVEPEREEAYLKIKPEIKRISKKLCQSIEHILIKQEGGIESGLYMGKRMTGSKLWRMDGKVFEKRSLPIEDFSIAMAVLVDVSGSMGSYDRIDYARKASLVLYDFCRKLSIPIMVYGHSTHYGGWPASQEYVDILAYADFESGDGKDHLRIMDMDTIGSNRDGVAIKFVGERLLKREEEIKLFILISDGMPAAKCYSGEIAKKDIQNVKRDLEKRGIQFYAAAIGDDREQIEAIYEDGFLNISDLDAMPMKLARLLTSQIK